MGGRSLVKSRQIKPAATNRKTLSWKRRAQRTAAASKIQRPFRSSALVAWPPSRIQTGIKFIRFNHAPARVSPAQSGSPVSHQIAKQANDARSPASGPARLTPARVSSDTPSACQPLRFGEENCKRGERAKFLGPIIFWLRRRNLQREFEFADVVADPFCLGRLRGKHFQTFAPFFESRREVTLLFKTIGACGEHGQFFGKCKGVTLHAGEFG